MARQSMRTSKNGDVLSCILNLEGCRHTRTRCRGIATGCVESVDFLQLARCAILGQELQPGHRTVSRPALALGRIWWCIDSVVLAALCFAKSHGRGVEIEKRRRGSGEEVMS